MLLSLAGRRLVLATATTATAAKATAPRSAPSLLLLRSLSTSNTTPGSGGSNMPVWPPPRSQLARMYEDEEDDFNSNDPELRAAALLRRRQQQEAAQGDDYLDDHHYVPGGGGKSASLSPHHDGYEAPQKGVGLQSRRREGAGPDEDDKKGAAAPVAGAGASAGASAVGAAGGSSSSSSAAGSSSSSGGPTWSWAQPQGERVARGPGGQRFGAAVTIPVKPRTLLAAEEVVGALEALGGQEVAVVDVRGKGNLDAEAMVFVSGRSGAHLRRMADTLVLALKQRQIGEREAPGVTGAEGYDCDDWMIVDGGNLIVHLMEPRQRKALALEAHWGAADFPGAGLTLPATRSDAAWEAAHDKALEANPADDDYDPLRDDHAARERAFRRLVHGKAGGRVRVRGSAGGRK